MEVFTILKAIDAKTASFSMSGNSGYDLSTIKSDAESNGYNVITAVQNGTYSISFVQKPKEDS